MNQRVLFRVFTVVGALLAAGAITAPAQAALVAHWTFDDNADDAVVADSGPNGYNGVMNNRTTAAAHVDGKVGGAFDFAGGVASTASDAVNLDAYVTSLTPSTFTLSQWVQFDGGAQWYNSWSDGINQSTYFTEINNGGPKLFNLNAGGSNLQAPAVDWGNGATWHHVAYTVGPSGSAVYIDGALAVSNSDTVGPANMAHAPIAFRIGEFLYATGSNPLGFNGRIDDTQIYDTAVSPDDAQYLFLHPGTVLPTAPPAGAWKNDASGDWNIASNWLGSLPKDKGEKATFGSAIQSYQIIYTKVPVTVGTLEFDNANMYEIVGIGLTLQQADGATDPALIHVLQGSHKINLPLTIAGNTNTSVADGAHLTISDPVTVSAGTFNVGPNVSLDSWVDVLSGAVLNASGALTGPASIVKKGDGTMVLSSAGNTYSGGTRVEGGTLEIAVAGALPPGRSLTIEAGGTVVLASGLSAGAAGAASATGPVPEPATALLLAAGLVFGLTVLLRNRRAAVK